MTRGAVRLPSQPRMKAEIAAPCRGGRRRVDSPRDTPAADRVDRAGARPRDLVA